MLKVAHTSDDHVNIDWSFCVVCLCILRVEVVVVVVSDCPSSARYTHVCTVYICTFTIVLRAG